MKAKLIKEANFYGLKGGDKIISTSDCDINSLLNYPFKLSLKNCQAIANGYDLDELAENEVRHMSRGDERLQRWYGFVDGFEKALEILGDKKFSEEDVISMIEKSRETGLTAQFLILTKQQTEWDVEVEMEYVGRIKMNKYHEIKPKLDEDGCLILSPI